MAVPCFRPISDTSSHFLPHSSLSTRHLLPSSSGSTTAVQVLITPKRTFRIKKTFLDDNIEDHSDGQKTETVAAAGAKKACLCSPSTHPGTFRCAMHKKSPRGRSNSSTNITASSYDSSVRLRYRRLAMNNSLMRIEGVASHTVKRSLPAPIKPSGHKQRRRTDFQPKPSRLSVMSKE